MGYAPPPLVDMGSCIDFAVVAGATITNSGFSYIDGDLGLSPGSAVVGFPPGEISGTMHVTDSIAAACMSDLAIAIADANSRPADATMSGELGGMTLAPGVYKSDSGFAITNTLYLDGQNDPDAAWIFIMATTLTVNTGASVVMKNYDNNVGVNVWWSVSERADIFSNAAMQGTVMATQSIATQDGASSGPLMANIGEVTLLSNVVSAYNSTKFPVPSSSSSDDSTTLSDGAIAGIVIGGVVFIAIVAGLIWFFLFSAGASGAAYSAPAAEPVGMTPV